MANLIITIISIALIAVAAIMAIYYGGQAYQNGQIDAIANSIITEAQQTLTAQRLWATNNNQPDGSNAGYNVLVSSKILSNYPALVGNQMGGAPTVGTTFDSICYNYQGYQGELIRLPLIYNNGNYILYMFGSAPSTSGCLAGFGGITTLYSSLPNHPVLKIAASINSRLKTVSANATVSTGTVPSSYLLPTGSTLASPVYTPWSTWGVMAQGGTRSWFWLDANGAVQTNYCYLVPWYLVICVFGPS